MEEVQPKVLAGREAMCRLLREHGISDENLAAFNNEDLDSLWRQGFVTTSLLRNATVELLLRIGLRGVLVAYICGPSHPSELQQLQGPLAGGKRSAGSAGLEGADCYADRRKVHPRATELWAELKQPLDGDLLTLPDCVWLGLLLPGKLYIRRCYRELWDIIKDIKKQKALVSGTPGIGKTSFQLYVMHWLAQQNRTVVLDWKDVHGRFLFKGGQAWHGGAEAFYDELQSPRTWFLVDAQLPQAWTAKTLLTCSPQHEVTLPFSKSSATLRFMPPWSLDELKVAAELFDVAPSRVEALFNQWGGSARYVLEYAADLEHQNKLQEASNGVQCEDVLLTTGCIEYVGEVSHRLIHIMVDPKDSTYIHHYLAFASAHVAGAVGDRLAAYSQTNLAHWLRTTNSVRDLASIRGCLFGRLAIHLGTIGRELEEHEFGRGR